MSAPASPATLEIPRRLLTAADLAKLLATDENTVRHWGRSGAIPAPLRIGTSLRWHPDDVAHLFTPRMSALAEGA